MEAELSERAAQRGQAITDYFLTLAEADLYGEPELSEQERKKRMLFFKSASRIACPGIKAFSLKIIGRGFWQSARPAPFSALLRLPHERT